MNFEKNTTINNTPQKVWEHLTEFKKMQKWNDCLLENHNISSGEIKKGFRSKTLMKEGKKAVWYEDELIKFEPCTLLVFKLEGKSLGKKPMVVSYNLSESGKGVKVSQKIEWSPSGLLLKLFHGTIEKMSKKKVEDDLNKLKQYLEIKE